MGVTQPAYLSIPFSGENDKELILSGKKTLTIRRGDRTDYEVGRTVHLVSVKHQWVIPATITDVDSCKLIDVPNSAFVDDGMEQDSEYLEQLREAYPGLRWGDLVTLIRFELQ
jgi:hypothetical protein